MSTDTYLDLTAELAKLRKLHPAETTSALYDRLHQDMVDRYKAL